MVITLLDILHISVCLFLMLVVLLQQGKGGGMGAAFGGGASATECSRRARSRQSLDEGDRGLCRALHADERVARVLLVVGRSGR